MNVIKKNCFVLIQILKKFLKDIIMELTNQQSDHLEELINTGMSYEQALDIVTMPLNLFFKNEINDLDYLANDQGLDSYIP